MADSALDSILGRTGTFPNDDGASVLSSVSSLRQVNGAILADILRTDVQSGQVVHDLFRLDRAGQTRAMVRVDGALNASDQAIAHALVGPDAPGLLLAGRAEVVSLSQASAAQAEAIAGLSFRRVDHVLEWPGRVVVAGADRDGSPALWAMIGERAPQAVPLEAVGLSELRALSALSGKGDMLFAAVADPVAGFDLYRYDLSAPAAGWQPLLALGAQRFAVNAAVAGMLAHPKGLLLGTAALAAPKRAVGQWGPELLLLSEDGSWDLIIGQPRFSPSGLILPASGLAPGLGSPINATVRAMHGDGVLTVLALQEHAGPTQEDRRKATFDLSSYSGAVRLYASFDLEDWTELPHDLPRDIGAVTCLHVTEEALFVGHEALGADAVPVTVVPLAA